MNKLDKFNADCDAVAAHMDARQAEIAQLRGFAKRVMESWPHGGIDGGDLQDDAVEFGLLDPTTPTESCGEGCVCAEYASAEEFAAGEVRCFARTALLDGAK